MKDFSIGVIYSVLAEFLGPYLWLAIGAAIAVVALAIVAFMRRGETQGHQVLWAIALGCCAAGLSMGAAPALTGANFANLNGLLDWAGLALIGLAAFVASALSVYGILGSFTSGRRQGTAS